MRLISVNRSAFESKERQQATKTERLLRSLVLHSCTGAFAVSVFWSLLALDLAVWSYENGNLPVRLPVI